MNSPALAITQPDGSRKYVHPVTGETVPSVTTCLKVIAKPNVVSWAARKSAEYAEEHWEEMRALSPPERIDKIRSAHEQISGVARNLGTAIHATVDAYAKGEPVNPVKEADPYLGQFIDFLFAFQPRFLENETTVWSHTHGYAGTLDFIARIDNHVVLADIKTGKGIYGEAALQASALAGADTIIRSDGTEEKIPEVEKLAVLHLRPRSWHLKLVPESDQEACFRTFLAAREILAWTENVAPDVFREEWLPLWCVQTAIMVLVNLKMTLNFFSVQ